MGTAKAYRFAKEVSRNENPCVVVVNNKHDKEMLKIFQRDKRSWDDMSAWEYGERGVLQEWKNEPFICKYSHICATLGESSLELLNRLDNQELQGSTNGH